MHFGIFGTACEFSATLRALIPPYIPVELFPLADQAYDAAHKYCRRSLGLHAATMVTSWEHFTPRQFYKITIVHPRDVVTFADLVPASIWKEEAQRLLRQATHDYAVAAKYDKAHACAVLAGIKSPLVHELERIAEMKQLETR